MAEEEEEAPAAAAEREARIAPQRCCLARARSVHVKVKHPINVQRKINARVSEKFMEHAS